MASKCKSSFTLFPPRLDFILSSWRDANLLGKFPSNDPTVTKCNMPSVGRADPPMHFSPFPLTHWDRIISQININYPNSTYCHTLEPSYDIIHAAVFMMHRLKGKRDRAFSSEAYMLRLHPLSYLVPNVMYITEACNCQASEVTVQFLDWDFFSISPPLRVSSFLSWKGRKVAPPPPLPPSDLNDAGNFCCDQSEWGRLRTNGADFPP